MSDSSAVPPEVMSEINAARKAIADAEKLIIDNGGHTPSTLLKMQPGSDLIFNDGASFSVSNPQYSLGMVRFDFRLPVRNSLVSPERDVELLVAGYPENIPAMDLISEGLLSQNPRDNLKFISANYKELRKTLPLRKFFRIADDGSYAITEKIPPYKGKLMTFNEFLENKTLTLEDHVKIGWSLINFVKETVGMRFITLHLSEAIVFDPRDSKWKFLTIDSHMRRFKTDNFVGPLKTYIELSLNSNKLGNKAFVGALYKKLEELDLLIMKEASSQSRLNELKARVPLAGKYKFNFVLNSGDRIQGELDSTSAARMEGEPIHFKGTLYDKNGGIKETIEIEKSFRALNVGLPSFSMFKEFKEIKDYFSIPLPLERNKPMRVKVSTYGEVEIVRME